MNSERLSHLLNQYRKGRCTDEERRELEQWYQSLEEPVSLDEYRSAEARDKLANEMLLDFKDRTRNLKQKHAMRSERKIVASRHWLRAIAATIIVAFGGLLYVYLTDHSGVVRSTGDAHRVFAEKNQFVSLPDGSTAILKANSTLIYPAAFTGDSREVTLTGEAFFDIDHMPDKPFIVHTGELKTRVLGTAFTVRAYADQQDVIVTVSEGRVQVENDDEVLGVITPDEQIVYSLKTTATEARTVASESETLWIKTDLYFDAVSFKNIAEELSRRYHMPISFQNPALEGCPITATFSGTETLEHLLHVLCTSRNASYQMEAGTVVISGDGC